MENSARNRLSALRNELATLEAEPWSNIGSWIAKATPIIRADWSSHFDDFRQIAVRPRRILSAATWAGQCGPTPSENAANKLRADEAKAKLLSFCDGLLAVSETNNDAQPETPPQQSLATIFYSWQSDSPNSTNRGFIGDSLERAIKELKSDPDLQVDPCLDRDTQNVPGSPDIAATIFEKIDKCGLFVCDVSIVNQSAADRPMSNPNVLIELGYAVKTLGWNRIVCVFNEATGRIQDLPFDLRQRRVRSYKLTESDDKADQRKLLTGLLKADLRHIFNAMFPQGDVIEAAESGGADAHSIRFSVDDWKVWKEPGNSPNDVFVVISQWRADDFRYSCTIRLRNELGWDDELHRLRMEFRQGERVLLADTYAFDDNGVVLPPKKWISINICYGVHEEGVFTASDTVWFVAETIGDNSKVAWLVASLNQTDGEQTERDK
jgi:hypothetical protein